jgi:hypothetical protein
MREQEAFVPRQASPPLPGGKQQPSASGANHVERWTTILAPLLPKPRVVCRVGYRVSSPARASCSQLAARRRCRLPASR